PGKTLNDEEARLQNIHFAKQVLGELGTGPRVFRFPYGKPFKGSQTAQRKMALESLRRSEVDYHLQWNYDSRDWEEDKVYKKLAPNSAKAQDIRERFIKRTVEGLCASDG